MRMTAISRWIRCGLVINGTVLLGLIFWLVVLRGPQHSDEEEEVIPRFVRFTPFRAVNVSHYFEDGRFEDETTSKQVNQALRESVRTIWVSGALRAHQNSDRETWVAILPQLLAKRLFENLSLPPSLLWFHLVSTLAAFLVFVSLDLILFCGS